MPKIVGSDPDALQARSERAQLVLFSRDGSASPVVTLPAFLAVLAGKIVRRLVRLKWLEVAEPALEVSSAYDENYYKLIEVVSNAPR